MRRTAGYRCIRSGGCPRATQFGGKRASRKPGSRGPFMSLPQMTIVLVCRETRSGLSPRSRSNGLRKNKRVESGAITITRYAVVEHSRGFANDAEVDGTRIRKFLPPRRKGAKFKKKVTFE